MKLTAITNQNMDNYSSISRTKTVVGLNILGCIAFVILMLAFNASNAAIPFAIQDSTKHYKSTTKVSYTNTGNGSRWTQKNGFSSMDIQYRGDIVVNDTDTDVVSISSGGYLKIKKTTFGNTRAIVIESGSGGTLTKEYYEGRKNLGFNEEGQKWLSDILLEVVRHTGIGGESRVKRFYKKGGTDAVLDEIRQIDSNSGKGRYFNYLLALSHQKELPAIAKKIGQYISSNSVRGELFREHSAKFMTNPTSAEALFEGVSYMTSNSEKSSILRYILREHQLEQQGMTGLLDVARKMTSNSERGSVLRQVNEQFPKNEKVIDAYFEVISSMTSNSEKGSVLRDLLRENNHSERVMKLVLTSIGNDFTSNTEMGSLLRSVAPKLSTNDELLDLYFRAVNRMSSNTEMGNSLYYLLNHNKVTSVKSQVGVFHAVRRMSSNTERGKVLRNSVDFLGKHNEVDDAFFDALSSLSSNTERGHVLRTIISRNTPDKALSIKILDATRYFSSNSETGSVLVSLSRVMPKDAQVIEAYKTAARRITSDSEYRRVLESLDR